MLTPEQETFCVVFVETGNATEAYRRAHDATQATNKSIEQAASRCLKLVKVKSRIAELKAALVADTVLDLGYVLGNFQRIHDRCMTPEGDEFNPAAANKAMENIGRLLGFYVERTESKSVLVDVSKVLDSLTDEQRAHYLALDAALKALPEGRTATEEG